MQMLSVYISGSANRKRKTGNTTPGATIRINRETIKRGARFRLGESDITEWKFPVFITKDNNFMSR